MLTLSVQIEQDLPDLSWTVAARSVGFMLTVVLFGVVFQSITKKSSEFMLAIGFLLPATGERFSFFEHRRHQSIF